MTPCPSPEQLRLLVADRFDQRQRQPVATHVASCATCQEVMKRLLDSAAGEALPDRLPPPPGDLKAPPPPTALEGRSAPAGPGPAAALPAVPGYEILGELGRGGMGVVYKARQLQLNRLVALKMILAGAHAGAADLARFRREAEAVAHLQHLNIVQVYEIGEQQGGPYFSLEFVDGGTLADRLTDTPLPARAAADLVRTLAQAVHTAHERGIVHRDLKPANVLLTADGTPKVTDFGLAKRIQEAGVTQSGAIMGTPSYMAPEQAAGKVREVGPAADIYALGAVLYECLTGRPPFRAASVMDTLLQVVNDEPVPPRLLNPRVPRDLDTICLKCLQKSRDGRYATAHLLAEDLGRYLDGRPILARPAGRAERLVKWARRSPARAAAVTAGLACVLALIAALYGLMVAARMDVALLRRQDETRNRFTALFTDAERRAAAAVPGDLRAWSDVERDTRAALELIATEPSLADFPLREPAGRLLARAEGHLADARLRAVHRSRLERLREHHADAVFFGTLATGLGLEDNLHRARQAVTAGLALFGVDADGDTPPAVDARFFTPAEARLVAGVCYELLLTDAELLARPLAGEPVAAWHDRLRQALRRLDRADRLQAGQRTHSGLVRRAEYLEHLGQTEDAGRARRLAQETAPTLAADFFLVGLDHYRREAFLDALRPLAAVLRLQPGHYGAEYVLAVCRLRAGRHQEAKEGLSRCLQQRPGFLWPHLLRGYAEMELGDYPAARADFEAVLSDPPDPSAAYVALVNRGVLAMRLRRWDDAVADFTAAIARQPDALPAHVNLALTYRQQAELPPWQRQAVLLAPQGVYTFAALEAHRRAARLRAVAALDRAIGHQPLAARLYHERGRLHLQLEDFRRARDDFARAVALAPNRATASTLADDLLELGRLLHRGKEHDAALRAYQAVLHVRPDHALAYRHLAEPLLALGRHDEASAALSRYLETIPVGAGRAPTPEQGRWLATAFKALGLLHVKRHDFRAAIDSYTQGLKLRRDPELLTLRGWAYLTFHAPELALPDFEEALVLRPDEGDALLGRADARVKLGQVAEALADAEEGLRHGPSTPRSLFNAARVHAQAADKLARQTQGLRGPGRASSHQARAVELLAQALDLMPTAERTAFWRDYVLADGALASLRHAEAMSRLADRSVRPPR